MYNVFCNCCLFFTTITPNKQRRYVYTIVIQLQTVDSSPTPNQKFIQFQSGRKHLCFFFHVSSLYFVACICTRVHKQTHTYINTHVVCIDGTTRPTQTNNLPVKITSNYPRSFVIVANQFVTTTCCINNASVAFVKKKFF